MSAVDLDAVLAGLRDFQIDAVEHVSEQFYGEDAQQRSGRFLIADETGLGKSVIARGVVAKAIRELEADPNVDRITIVYICSNRDLAGQNLGRLNVTGQREIAMATRLSLLAKETARLKETAQEQNHAPQESPEDSAVESPAQKPINLVSFTPGTSFTTASWRQGSAEERALLVLLLDELLEQTPHQQHLTRVMFRGTVSSAQRFSDLYVGGLAEKFDDDGIDPAIRNEFDRLARPEAVPEFIRVRDWMADVYPEGHEELDMPAPDVPWDIWHPLQNAISKLRALLARASVQTLQPNLVILDEFQRFKSLLDPERGGESAELADALFSYPDAKVLLLSATPYKPFTRADEDEEDHYEDFLATISFLSGHNPEKVANVRAALSHYRDAVGTGHGAEAAAEEVRAELLPVMSRSERPSLIEERDLVSMRHIDVPVPSAEDLSEWVALADLGKSLGSAVSPEYWKSVPYFVNFMSGYRIGQQLTELPPGPQRQAIAKNLRQMRSLKKTAVERSAELDPGSGPLRALIAETLDQEWWKLLWMPPSMPYLTPGPVYSSVEPGSVTKQVLFSAWSAAPTAIATLLSHEAERRMMGLGKRGRNADAPENATQRFTYRRDEDGQGTSLSTLAIFWPHPSLLSRTDQLQAARENHGLLDPKLLVDTLQTRMPTGEPAQRAWEAFFAVPGAFDQEVADLAFTVETERRSGGSLGLESNIAQAQQFTTKHDGGELSHPDLARIAAFSPGSVAYRAVSTIAGEKCTRQGKWRAAFTIAEGLRTLFNRPEVQGLLDQLAEGESPSAPYWRRVLDYCADGNLRAVLDEYLFQLWCETGQAEMDDEKLIALGQEVAAALGLRPARYVAHEADLERTQLPMQARFAVRYGGGEQARSETDSAVARQSVVRSAFNSPFAPFVLASTSVGQEGIDFHWWSHSVVHWNLPSNPVDFEQREGRVNRYGGHAVRKNVARAHWNDVLDSTDACAWRAAFSAAEKVETEEGEFSPWWVYRGESQIQRVLVQYPMSRDIERFEQLRSALTRYRLTLGQPRQEDMVEMLLRQNIDATTVPTINLRPPKALGTAARVGDI
ncbi:DEAD/DEAH box helicase [Nesterenkonia sp. MY13]|uniref:DEAD/DEAH box helicase n=1 Tax=Nesterenkonia sedimenti TaxID=1463632 RepID=A0A7X8TK32_9MICC|nr:helicase-related protein [Nesterenkonia sedimenti]NLS10236.1 DEAD/DEAH box helicase [Nesterenkonia sedimenti]